MRSVDTKQMREIDEEAIRSYKIPRLILMEHAGLEVAKAAIKNLDNAGKFKKIFIFCGTGFNGGDGMVAARHLYNWGYKIVIYLVGDESKCKKETLSNLNILKKLDIEINKFKSTVVSSLKKRLAYADLIIDAILGIGLKGKVRKPLTGLIKCLNESNLPIISVDVPSGLDSDTGKICGTCIRAKETVTFAAPKKGFFLENGPHRVGEVILRDIGIPKELIENKSKEEVV